MLITLLLPALICSASPQEVRPLAYSGVPVTQELPFLWSGPDDACVARFRQRFATTDLVQGQSKDADKVLTLARWILAAWRPPPRDVSISTSDPVELLALAHEGRCPTWCYAMVLRAALASVGIQSRSLAMHTEDVETRPSGATALACECYLNDEQRWILVDTDWHLLPLLDAKAVNAVELQRALVERRDALSFVDLDDKARILQPADEAFGEYADTIRAHIHYLSIILDQRVDQPFDYGADKIMLTPVGGARPVKYQVDKGRFTNTLYFDTIAAFYAAPNLTLSHARQNPSYDASGPEVEWRLVLDEPEDASSLRLRQEYGIDELLAPDDTVLEKARKLCVWAQSRWKHTGDSEPKSPEPLAILEAAAKGARFRCVEYSTILTAALTAVGIPARCISAQTANVEFSETGAGHVFVEAYSAELQKWFMLDGQWGLIPMLDDTPLNAVELADALKHARDRVRMVAADAKGSAAYARWIERYLYYLSFRYDQRAGSLADFERRGLILVPDGATAPRVFQRRFSVPAVLTTTHSKKVFYRAR